MSSPVVARFMEDFRRAFEADDPQAAQKPEERGNVERVLAVYGHIATGNWQAFGDALTEDVTLEILAPPDIPFAGSWRGREHVVAAVRHNFSLIEDQEPRVLAVVAQGAMVVVFGQERGRIRETDQSYEVQWVQQFTFTGELLSRMWQVLQHADN